MEWNNGSRLFVLVEFICLGKNPRPETPDTIGGMAMHSEHPFSEPLPEEAAPRTSRGIQSVEVGGQLLKALVHTGRPMALKDLAREAGMTAAKAHPYLVSFGKLGLIEQDPGTGHYGLGSLAMQLGLISLQQKDPVRMAIAELPGLALRVGATVAISVWGNHGPTIIQVEQGPADVHVTMRHGTTASVRYTANGKLFAAFMPRAQVEQGPADVHVTMRHGTTASVRYTANGKLFAAFMPHAQVEQALAHDGDPQALQDPLFAQELTAIRQQGISTVREGLVRGIGAVAAPVFDGFGRLVLCLTAIGPVATLDVSVEGTAAQQLRETAQALSRRLGASGPWPVGELVPR